MAGLSGKHSRRVSFEFGFKILDNFLGAFGVPSAGIDAAFEGAAEVSFSFANVRRSYVDKNVLGNLLRDHRVDAKNPAARIYFGRNPWSPLVIDSTIESSNFTFRVERSSRRDFKVDLGAIQQVIDAAKVGVKVGAVSARTVTFKGRQHLTFAFTCVRMYLDPKGRITSLPDEPSSHRLQALAGAGQPEHEIRPGPVRVLLHPSPAMLSWDDSESPPKRASVPSERSR